MRYGEQGEDVQRVQQTLIDWGYQLPKYGADGHLGDETWLALSMFSRAELGTWAPEVPDVVVQALLQDVPVPAPDPGPVPDARSVVEVVDLRPEQSDPAPKSRVSGGRTVLRAPRNVTGIVLHQTATLYGVSDRQVNAAGGDADLALQRRTLNVACHAMAFRKGWVVLSNDLRSYIHHGNSGFNSRSLGLEVEGRYPGLANAPAATTWGGDPTELTQETIEAAREGIRILTEKGRAMGMPIEYVWAHRQSSSSRRADPSESLWKSVVIDYAVPVLGLKTEPKKSFGDGLPIPLEWDPNGKGSY